MGHLRAVVGDPESRADLVPVDEVAARVLLASDAKTSHDPPTPIYHATAGLARSVRIRECWDGIRDFFGVRHIDRRVTLGYLKTGNIDSAIVYRTDVREGQGFDVVASFPEGSHTPIVYPGAVLSRSSHREAATAFLRYLSDDRGQQALRDFGFVPLE